LQLTADLGGCRLFVVNILTEFAMLSAITNQQLFTESYICYLAGSGPADTIGACRQTIGEWREAYPDLAGQALPSYVARCLSALNLSYRLAPGRIVLYADQTQSSPLGLCLLVERDDVGRATKGRHYHAQLVAALHGAQLSWGIITNGKAWRLCHANSPAPYESYLQVDLDAALGAADLRDFAPFYHLFGLAAFAASGEGPDGRPQAGLDRRLAAAEALREETQRYLRGRVESILQALCLGFVEDEGAATYTRETLDEIYRNAIYLLYRILFLFYAEARALLPVDHAPYRAAGLAGILETARRLQEEGVEDADRLSLWKRLTRLFVAVDDGDDELRIRPYNGGLFSDEEKPYLKAHRISDAYLARALYELGYLRSGKGPAQPIDYRDLTVRHLGTLYEGLLEYRLNLVDREPVVVREKDGKRTYVPQSQAGVVKRTETVLEVGQAYFADDKGERKSSGSYYTPEDVVQYIVGNTVRPALEERLAGLKLALDEAQAERSVAPTADERARIERYADQLTLDAIKSQVLTLKVLDPAMGSAHFLVAAGQIITNTIVEALNLTDWPNDDVDCDALRWKRRVVERCLFGVDVNPLAQELGKLALWLSSASAGKPLTFLNPHIKTGNSLYGTPLKRLATLPDRKGAEDDLFDLARQETIAEVLKKLRSIAEAESERIEDVHFKEQSYAQAQADLQRLKDIAHVWLATLFSLVDEDGEPIPDRIYDNLREDVTMNFSQAGWESRVENDYWLREARVLKEKHKFFHWELEFPESVVDSRCQFDVVVANPPYVRTSADQAIHKLYETSKCGDLYAWFAEKALSLYFAR
jgi:hypothetical protein